MEPSRKGNMNRHEMFEMLSRKCKSRAIVSIRIGLLSLLFTVGIIIFILNYHPQNPYCDDVDVIVFLTCFIVTGCALVLSIPYDHLFVKKVDQVDTPAQLLNQLKKRTRFLRICFIVPFLVTIGCEFYSRFRLYTFRTDLYNIIWVLALGIGAMLCALHVFKPEKISYTEEETIVELEDLIDMK